MSARSAGPPTPRACASASAAGTGAVEIRATVSPVVASRSGAPSSSGTSQRPPTQLSSTPRACVVVIAGPPALARPVPPHRSGDPRHGGVCHSAGVDDADPQQAAEAQAAAMLAGDAATRGLGIEVSGVGPGRATAAMTVTPAMLNGHGTCHGGYLFLLADTAFAFACNTRGEPAVAAGADVAFLAPVREGEVVVAEAAERVLAGRSGLYDVTVRRGGATVLEFRGRSRTLPRRPTEEAP